MTVSVIVAVGAAIGIAIGWATAPYRERLVKRRSWVSRTEASWRAGYSQGALDALAGAFDDLEGSHEEIVEQALGIVDGATAERRAHYATGEP